MKKSTIILVILLIIPSVIVLFYNNARHPQIVETVTFHQKLTHYKLFKGPLADLNPTDNAITYELSSELFTDYAQKQRFIVLPDGEKIQSTGQGLPVFPEGTLIAKTFFYQHSIKHHNSKYIVETRLLIKKDSQWNAATYQWNETQDEALLILKGEKVPILFKDHEGNIKEINYQIPSKEACITCHRQNDQLVPIGPKVQNLGRMVNLQNRETNELKFLQHEGVLALNNKNLSSSLVAYNDTAAPIDKRARAYLDINCAHCHNPSGTANFTLIDLRYETPFKQTGIKIKQGKIGMRMAVLGEMHMPKLGTTVIDKEGLKLVLDYIKTLDQHNK
ncbi:hypothetical protein [Flavobacterium sp. HSC-61S13]|uniref:hypothetical protein n=1 Tax=Flavobacterium sp. HSC-61S13 TaxID=2910963 RepID=UPI00209CCBC0|nr:hypothetical protein [Flavobacterium sp. HSC-61S13]MCP1995912.1 putative repeat protein (TIGR03806 family) [Flavobacterium sp. HSC-61S13]